MEVKDLSKKLNIDERMINFLIKNGYNTESKINRLLNFSLKDVTDVMAMKDADKAISRLKAAVNNKEHVLIYADYDCDGISAGSIMKNTLTYLGCTVDVYINDRMTEGFGLCKSGIDKALNKYKDFTLVVTVDNGIDRIEEVDYIMQKGIDVVITDHHEPLPDGSLSKAIANVNAHRLDENEGVFIDLCGAGLAYKLCFKLYMDIKGLDRNKCYQSAIMRHNLALCAMATVCDLVALKEENRFFVKYGIEAIKNSNLAIWYELRCKLRCVEVNEETFGFTFGPLINSLSRMGSDPLIAIELFTTLNDRKDGNERIGEIVDILIKNNEARKVVCKEMSNKAKEDIAKQNSDDKIVVLYGDYAEGVAGITASDIKSYINKPTIILCPTSEDKEVYKGSARCVEGIDIKKTLDNCADLMANYGGHELAAGITIPLKNIPEFIERINNNIVYTDRKAEDDVDFYVSCKTLTPKLIFDIALFAPFGNGFPKPKMCLRATITSVKGIKGRHLKFELDGSMASIMWNCFEEIDRYYIGQSVMIKGQATINSYDGKPQMIASDITEWDISKNGIAFDLVKHQYYKIEGR